MELHGSTFDPDLLDLLETLLIEDWQGTVWRRVIGDTDPLRASLRGARWNPPEEEVLYCSIERETAAAEVEHLLARQSVIIDRQCQDYLLNVSLSRVCDLRDTKVLRAVDIDPDLLLEDDVELSQRIGAAVARLEYGGLLVPSLRYAGVNLVVFVNRLRQGDLIDLHGDSMS